MIYEWVLTVLLMTSSGEFGAIHSGFHSAKECADAKRIVYERAPELRFEDGSKPSHFSASCSRTEQLPERS